MNDHWAESRIQAVKIVQLLQKQRNSPLFVALDGPSGSGKSTIAALIAKQLNAGRSNNPRVTVIEGDQFYAGGSAATWDQRSAVEKVAYVIDWRRQRTLLTNLRQHGSAVWRAFDWASDDWDTPTAPLQCDPIHSVATEVVILEGAYSARPELANLFDLRILVRLPKTTRRQRIQQREGADYEADWDARWAEAEAHYFGSILQDSLFDLVLDQQAKTGH